MEPHICKQCHKKYDVKEVERQYGGVSWKHLYCSAYCYTNAKGIIEVKPSKWWCCSANFPNHDPDCPNNKST